MKGNHKKGSVLRLSVYKVNACSLMSTNLMNGFSWGLRSINKQSTKRASLPAEIMGKCVLLISEK